jgi:ABC-type lipoprotein release transport system permease subunit
LIRALPASWSASRNSSAYAILMVTVCALACLGPTLRALLVEPTEALREEQ